VTGVHDPLEGLTASGTIRTGARRENIADPYSDLLDAAVRQIADAAPDASVYLYGSVATGTARAPGSDVDLLTVGLPPDTAASLAGSLSSHAARLSRGVEIAAATEADFAGHSDEAYGNRVFLHHYCVRLSGPEIDQSATPFPGDQRAARGFNGDVGRHLERWRARASDSSSSSSSSTGLLGRLAARKTLLAVAGLVSVHDSTWTTDRTRAAKRWGEVHADLADGLGELLDWAVQTPAESSDAIHDRVNRHLATTIEQIVEQFDDAIGLWAPDSAERE